jgi:Asp-tRNA(Asn)/Glu-tRNA(Gln) amidotransferase A subunit family amidase
MTAAWPGDACSLVEAFRRGTRSPVEELDAVLAAIEASSLNAFSHVDADAARRQAEQADVDLPLGGVPVAIKELTSVTGWPATEACVALADRVADHDATAVARLRAAGVVLIGATTASEFGGLNFTRTKLHGITRNPWDSERTPGGSSGGSAAAVAGGIVTLASAGDGGGSIRIPAAFCGLPGLKVTYGRIPRGPGSPLGALTDTPGCLSRSVRDIARWLDITNGFDSRDPLSLPRVEGYEAGLGTCRTSGLTATLVPGFGGAVVDPEVAEAVAKAAELLASTAGLRLIDRPVELPGMGVAWALANLAGVLEDLGDRWPGCAADLTPQIRYGLEFASAVYNLQQRADLEDRRRDLNEAMAAVFDDVDLILAPTCPDVAFSAAGWDSPTLVAGQPVDPANHGALTIPSNVYGNPAVSIPAGTVRGLPVGLQVIGRHHSEPLLLDLALAHEQVSPWPVTAPR